MLVDTQSRAIEASQEGHQLQRGPMRPDQLISVRQRQDRQLAGHRFRAIDTVLLVLVAALFLRRGLDRSLLEAPVADVIPVVAGLWTTWWLLRSLGLYRFGRTEGIFSHLARVGAAVAGRRCRRCIGAPCRAARVDDNVTDRRVDGDRRCRSDRPARRMVGFRRSLAIARTADTEPGRRGRDQPRRGSDLRRTRAPRHEHHRHLRRPVGSLAVRHARGSRPRHDANRCSVTG